MSKISPILNKIIEFPKRMKYSKNDLKEIDELHKDLLDRGFKEIKTNYINKDIVIINAKQGTSEFCSELNFAKRTINQNEHYKRYVFTIDFPHVEIFENYKGTLDGLLKWFRQTVIKSNDNGGREVATEIQDKISGNTYKCVEYPVGHKKFYKKIEDKFVELFPDKNKNN